MAEAEIEESMSPKEASDEDDGELCTDDEGDLEEGELKEEGTESEQGNGRQVCRFFHKGKCFYGNFCRFLHVDSDKGNYNMFAPPPPPPPAQCMYPDFYGPGNTRPPIQKMNRRRPVPEFILPPVPQMPPSPPVDNAWERGLKEAQALVQKKMKKQDEELELKKKSLNLSQKVDEKNLREFNKENDCKLKRKKHKGYSYKFSNPGHRRLNDAKHLEEIQSRSRSDELFDPEQRSKSPKGLVSRSDSYSSISSLSSDESRSSSSYSHHSSQNSNHNLRRASSSRSRSRTPSRSRSYSRSISMSSVSSDSSGLSPPASPSSRNNSHQRKVGVKGKNDASSSHHPSKYTSNKKKSLSHIGAFDEEADPLEEQFQAGPFAPSSLRPYSAERSRRLDKQQAKGSLAKPTFLPKKNQDIHKRPPDEPSTSAVSTNPKRPNSRRDELLKQLKAVEDAIARKRAKV